MNTKLKIGLLVLLAFALLAVPFSLVLSSDTGSDNEGGELLAVVSAHECPYGYSHQQDHTCHGGSGAGG